MSREERRGEGGCGWLGRAQGAEEEEGADLSFSGGEGDWSAGAVRVGGGGDCRVRCRDWGVG